MDAARLLYGELELNASSALFAVDQLDEGFDILADQIVETQDGLGGLDNSLIESSEATNALSGSFESLGQSLSVIGIFMILAGVLYELISSSESFKKVITELQKAFEPLLKVIGEFAEGSATISAAVASIKSSWITSTPPLLTIVPTAREDTPKVAPASISDFTIHPIGVSAIFALPI